MLIPFLRRCGRFIRCERAVSALEYAVLAGVIIAGVGTALVTFSDNVADAITGIGGNVENVADNENVDADIGNDGID